MIFFISIVLLFSCFFLYILFKTKEIIPNDFLFYGSIADYLNIYGIENYNLNIYDTKGVKLYHYFNEWSSAFFSRIFGLPGSVALVYVYFPLVMSVLFIGIYALVNSLFKLSSLQSLFYTSVFFISSQFWGGTSVAYLIQIKGFSIRFGSLFITANYLKLLIVITFFAAFLILIRRNQRLLSMAFLLAIPFIWPTTLFGVFGGLILYFVYESIKIKELHLKELLFVGITAISFLAFYKFFGGSDNDYEIITQKSYLEVFYENFKIHEALFLIPKIIISRIYYFIMFIIIIIFNYNKFIDLVKSNREIFNKIFIFILFLSLSSLFGNMFFHYQLDSDQIFGNLIDNTVLKFVSFFVLILTIKSIKTRILIAIFVVFSILTITKTINNIDNKISSKDLNTYKTFGNYIAKTNSKKYAINLLAENSVLPRVATSVYSPLNFLRTYTKEYFPINISIYDRKYKYSLSVMDNVQFNSTLSNSPYFHFINKHNLNYKDINSKLKFLEYNKIDFLIFEKKSLDINFIKNIKIVKTFNFNDFTVIEIDWN